MGEDGRGEKEKKRDGDTRFLTFPIAKRPLSKNSTTPSVKNASPNVTSPNPISACR